MNAGFDDAREFWDKRYAAREYIFGVEPNVFLVSQRAHFWPHMRVLDIACGEGRNAVWLAKLGCEMVGVDISPLALDKARRLAAQHAVSPTLVEGDIRQWHWQAGQFDAVLAIFIQFAAPEGRSALFEGMCKTLKPGGLLFLQGFTPKQLQYTSGGPKELSHLYTKALLRESLTGMEILHLNEHEGELREGTKHVGKAALVDLVARKRVEVKGASE
jgi:cyclopropane fatty-acyl-phospholipid synthase-like methyltransferase